MALERQKVYSVFYRDYAYDVAISSAKPESLLGSRVAPLAERLLVNEDNFLGIVDRNDVILQAYLDGPDVVVLELLRPDSASCLRLTVNLALALELLGNLPDVFDAETLPGAVLTKVGATN